MQSSSRLACIGTITLVFLTGAITGAVAMNLGAHKWMHRQVAPFWTEGGKERKVEYTVRFKPGERAVADLNALAKPAGGAQDKDKPKDTDKDKPKDKDTDKDG